MSNGHTPGPWKDGIEIPLKAISCERAGFSLAFINTGSPKRDEQAQANARLIAAAPDLLKACEKALDDLVDEDGVYFSGDESLVQQLRAAIAKARGAPC